MLKKVYKIFERDKEQGVIKNLFKGINNSRTLKAEQWYLANIKRGRDSGDRWYITGIHCLPTRELAEDYLDNFRVEKDRIVVECYTAGGLRNKPTNDNVILAEDLYITEEEHQKHFKGE